MGLPGPAGPNTVPQGTLATPSINFEGDTGTGIFSPGAGQIALVQNGTLFVHGLNLSAALGRNALAVSTGDQNVAVGFDALSANSTGAESVAVGYQALAAHTTGSDNVAVGHRALASLTFDNLNTAVGSGALSSHIVGDGNTAVGGDSQALHASGENNTAVGAEALKENRTGEDNTVVGAQALTYRRRQPKHGGRPAGARNAVCWPQRRQHRASATRRETRSRVVLAISSSATRGATVTATRSASACRRPTPARSSPAFAA